jgi:hypothetical protein
VGFSVGSEVGLNVVGLRVGTELTVGPVVNGLWVGVWEGSYVGVFVISIVGVIVGSNEGCVSLF